MEASSFSFPKTYRYGVDMHREHMFESRDRMNFTPHDIRDRCRIDAHVHPGQYSLSLLPHQDKEIVATDLQKCEHAFYSVQSDFISTKTRNLFVLAIPNYEGGGKSRDNKAFGELQLDGLS